MNQTAKVLIEALPFIQRFYNRRIVIKYGGAAMEEESLIHSVMEDIVLMKYVGMRPIVVHGGGPKISAWMNKVGKESEFVQGLRVTDAETVEIAEMVLAGTINKGIVLRINQHGGQAIGLCGKDANLIVAEKHTPQIRDEDGNETTVDLGYVGKIIGVNTQPIITLDEAGYIPVIAPNGTGVDGQTYNINADTMAGEIASALQAEKLILLTDTRGICQDTEDISTLISTIRMNEINALIDEGTIKGGMIPKIEACATALLGGVSKAHIIDGRIEHSLLLEVLTEGGIGTEIIR
ncbi:MAG: acetylglutamate kinase [Candidatus Poribacteria bacterium]|nr:acetylglutamate kinase [Candidatus Poribacteria bacterium]